MFDPSGAATGPTWPSDLQPTNGTATEGRWTSATRVCARRPEFPVSGRIVPRTPQRTIRSDMNATVRVYNGACEEADGDCPEERRQRNIPHQTFQSKELIYLIQELTALRSAPLNSTRAPSNTES